MRVLAACFLVLFAVLSGPARGEGSVAAGKAKSVTCAACHGSDGNGVNPEWPRLAGQDAGYIVAQLQAYKSGMRVNALMNGQAAALSAGDMANLGAYYASLTLRGGLADPALVSLGQRIYRGGNPATGAPACAGCHGPTGRGNPAALMPAIGGQYATYTAGQLRAYASGERRSDSNQVMRNIASALSESEIEAVSSYVEGLR